MKILVTGATGFVGAAFIKLAAQQGHEIGALVRPQKLPAALQLFSNQVKCFPGTLTDFPLNEIRDFKADACVHTAWLATPGVYLHSPENELWVKWSLNFLREIADDMHVVVLGTCIEYQITDKPLSEQATPILPTSTYAHCKNQLRLALEAEEKIALCWGRVFYPYGPGEHPDRLCSSLIRRLSNNERVVLNTPNSTKDYIFIEDLARAILTAVEKKYVGALNFGTGQGVQIRQIAQNIAEEMNKRELVEELSPALVDPLGYVVADASRLQGLGWQPKTALRDGLKKLMVSTQSGNKV